MSKIESATAAVEAGVAVKAAPLPRFKVRLNCPTPLVHKELVVEAATDEAAWKAFCAANGISGSDAERTIEKTNEPLTDLKAKK